MPHDDTIRAFLDAERAAQAAFLAELVKVPSDNPPGDCDPTPSARPSCSRASASRSSATRCPRSWCAPTAWSAPPTSWSAAASATGGPGDRAQRAWRRGAARRGLDPRSRSAPRSSTAGCTAAASPFPSPTSPPTPGRSWRSRRSGAKLAGTVELHLTYDEEAGGEIGPGFLLREGISRAGPRPQRRLLLRRRHRAQWLPAPRGGGQRQVGARRDALHRHRRAGGGDARSSPPSTPGARRSTERRSRRSRASAARSSPSG